MNILLLSKYSANLFVYKQVNKMRIFHHHFCTSSHTVMIGTHPFHGKNSSDQDSGVYILSITLFFTSIIVGALIMIWYFYAKTNAETQQEQNSPNPYVQPVRVVYESQKHVAAPIVYYPPLVAEQPPGKKSRKWKNRGIQTSGSLDPVIETIHFGSQTEEKPSSVAVAIQTSGDIRKTSNSNESAQVASRPGTPVSVYNILKSSEDIKLSQKMTSQGLSQAQINLHQASSNLRRFQTDALIANEKAVAVQKGLIQTQSQNIPQSPAIQAQANPSVLNTCTLKSVITQKSGGGQHYQGQTFVQPLRQPLMNTQPTNQIGVSQPLIIPVISPQLPPLPLMPLFPQLQAQVSSPPSKIKGASPQGLQYPTLPSVPRQMPFGFPRPHSFRGF